MVVNNRYVKNILKCLAAQEKKPIYEGQKQLIKESSPLLSKQTKFYIAFYLLGCVLIYFGIISSSFNFITTGTWKYEPENTIFESLANSAVEIIRPFFAAFLFMLPIVLVYTFLSWFSDLYKKLHKRLRNKG